MQWQSFMFINDIYVGARCDEKIQAFYAAFESAQMQTSSLFKIHTIHIDTRGRQFATAFNITRFGAEMQGCVPIFVL